MAIDINNTVASQSQTTVTRKGTTGTRSQPTTDQGRDGAVKQETVTLSDEARIIDSSVKTGNMHSEFNNERVTEIKNSINAGTYEINSAEIAVKLRQFSLG